MALFCRVGSKMFFFAHHLRLQTTLWCHRFALLRQFPTY